MKKKLVTLSLLIVSFIVATAQNDVMYMMKGGNVVGQHNLAEIDSLTFYDPAPQVPVSVTGVSLAQSTLSLSVGATQQLVEIITPANATNKSVTWQSNNTGVVTVSNSGLVKAIANGSAIITVRTVEGNFSSQITVSVSTPVVSANPYKTGSIPNAKYIGRWSSISDWTGNWDLSHYNGAKIKVKFQGTTAKLNIKDWDNHIYFSYRIDGGSWVNKYGGGNQNKVVDLTPIPLSDTTHDLEIIQMTPATLQAADWIKSSTLTLDPGKLTLAPDLSSKHIEFIGDSITVGYGLENAITQGYAGIIGEELGVEYTRVAWSSITMGGMATRYFQVFDSGTWDFSAYQPDVICVNLGQNGGIGDPTAYKNFLLAIRAKVPNAYILALNLFNPGAASGSQANIAAAVTQANDPKIIYISQTGSLCPGDIHPNAAGNRVVADVLKPIVAGYLGL